MGTSTRGVGVFLKPGRGCWGQGDWSTRLPAPFERCLDPRLDPGCLVVRPASKFLHVSLARHFEKLACPSLRLGACRTRHRQPAAQVCLVNLTGCLPSRRTASSRRPRPEVLRPLATSELKVTLQTHFIYDARSISVLCVRRPSVNLFEGREINLRTKLRDCSMFFAVIIFAQRVEKKALLQHTLSETQTHLKVRVTAEMISDMMYLLSAFFIIPAHY